MASRRALRSRLLRGRRNLAELDERGIKFLTLRMRSPALVKQINALTTADFKPLGPGLRVRRTHRVSCSVTRPPTRPATVTLDRPAPHHRPKVHDSPARMSNYPGTVRQLIVTGLGREAPTVIITNDTDSTWIHRPIGLRAAS
jgi:hypothetical protein